MSEIIRLPLDLLFTSDSEDLETALTCEWAVEHEAEIYFCKDTKELKVLKEDLGQDIKFYRIDEIETDRIQAVIDVLNLCEEDKNLSHLIDRLVR